MCKRMLRVLALMLTLAMALSLTACGQDNGKIPAQNNQETQKSEDTKPTQVEPMVWMYVYAEQIENGNRYWWTMESDWQAKQEIKAQIYGTDSAGDKILIAEETYSGDTQVRVNYRGGLQISRETRKYQDGKCVYICKEYLAGEDKSEGHIMDENEYSYDNFGRLLSQTVRETYTDPANSKESVMEYIFKEDGSGSMGLEINTEGGIKRLYDDQYRLTRETRYFGAVEYYRFAYTYNSAGSCLTYEVFREGKSVSFTEYVYEAVEVPLSVAEKYPMFKWEYIA